MGAGDLVWHIFLWQPDPMVGALADEEDKVLVLIYFLCYKSQDCFPRWEEGVCAVQCSLLPKLIVVWELLFPTPSPVLQHRRSATRTAASLAALAYRA